MANLKADAFSDEQPVIILQFESMVEQAVSDEMKQRFPGMKDKQLVVTWNRLAPDREGRTQTHDNLSITNNAVSKTANFAASIRQNLGLDFEDENTLTRALRGMWLKTQFTKVPGMRVDKERGATMYRKVLGIASQSEVDEARSTYAAAAPQGEAAVSFDDPADLVMAQIGDGGTFEEIRDRVFSDDALRSNGRVVSGVLSKTILNQLVSEGRLAEVGDRYEPVTTSGRKREAVAA